MKKTLITLALASALAPLAAYAEFAGPSAHGQATSVSAAQRAADDAPVVLEGKIVRQLDHEHFMFRDIAGKEVIVDIDHEIMPAEKFDQNTRLRLHGEVDKEWNGTKIDVQRVDILR